MNANAYANPKVAIDFSLLRSYFSVSPDGLEHPAISQPASALLTQNTVAAALEQAKAIQLATSLEYPASSLGISLYGLVASQLVVLAEYDVWIDLSIDNIDFQLKLHDTYVQAGYKIRELEMTNIPEGPARDSFLLEAWRSFITRTVVPLIEKISSSAGVKPQLIWNQYGSRQTFLRDYMKEQAQLQGILKQFEQEDARLSGLAPEWFGLRRNPFVHKPAYIESPYQEGKQITIRSSCCMYDKRENGTKCYNCPKLTEQDRAERWDQIKAKSS